jgi:tetratricopeptide (TPR) repeat protein
MEFPKLHFVNTALIAAFVAAAPASGIAVAAQSDAAQPAKQTSGAAQPGGALAPKSQGDHRRDAYERYLDAERLERQGDFAGAVEAYKQAIELAPEEEEPRIALARLYLGYRNTADAQAAALEAIRMKKDSVAAHAILAQIYVAEALAGRDFDSMDPAKAQRAITELEEVVRLDEKADIGAGAQATKALSLLGIFYKGTGKDEKAVATFERLSRVDANSPRAFLSLAQLYYDDRKYREAARAAEQARKLDPSELGASRLLARSYLRTGRTVDAIAVFKQALATLEGQVTTAQERPLPTQARQQLRDMVHELRLEYADALMRAGKYTEATESVQPILTEDRKNIRAVRVVADASRRAGRRDLAVKALEDALVGQDVNDSLELVYALAETYEEMEQFDKAIATYEEALSALVNPDGTVSQRNSQNAGVILQRIALANRLAGRPAKMKETFERMRKVLGAEETLPDALEIQSALDTADYDGAIAIARRAGASAPNDEKRSFRFLEAQALGKKGELPAATKLLEGMLAKGSTDADVYAVMSAIQLDAGDVKGAERSIRKALEIEPSDTSLLITLSSVQDRAKQYSESEASLRKVLEVDPDNATALNNLGYFLTERKERLDEALTLIQRAVNIDPTNGSFLDSLGWLYFQMGKVDEARRYLEQAVIYEHRSSTIREHLGDLYAKIGEAEKARQHWEMALRLANEPEEIARLKDKLSDAKAR